MNDVNDVNDANDVNVVQTVNGELIWETFFSQLLYVHAFSIRLWREKKLTN